MKALCQRVSSASVRVEGEQVAAIGPGLLILLGVARGDGEGEARALAGKAGRLRVFEEPRGKMNRSLRDTGGEALVVPQFTLLADTSRGNRPGFEGAAPPAEAEPLFRLFCQELAGLGVGVARGIFGADMEVALVNEGPVTIMLRTERDEP